MPPIAVYEKARDACWGASPDPSRMTPNQLAYVMNVSDSAKYPIQKKS